MALAILILVAYLGLLAHPPGAAVHNGGTGLEDSDLAGCHCHNVEPAACVTLNLMGLPERYVPDEVYELIITVAGGPPVVEAMQNTGGFMLSCTNGSFAVPQGSDLVQVFNDDQSASHTMAGNDYRQWRLLWRAPKEGVGHAVFHLSANTVNGDGVETGELDAYNQLTSVSLGEEREVAAAAGPSEWGVPLSAYWLGVIAFVGVLVLTWVAYYLIKGTSHHHAVHIGSRRRYRVEESTPPSSFGAALVIVVLSLVEVGAALTLWDGIRTGGGEVGLAVNLAVVLALFLIIVVIYRSVFVPRLVRIESDDGPPRTGVGP